MKKLIRKISRYKEKDIQFILQKLSEENIPSNIKEVEDETIVLDDEQIKIIKNSLVLLIQKDGIFLKIFERILKEDDRVSIADPLGANETLVIVAGIGVLGTIANNLIKSQFPNEEIKKDGENEEIIRRDYSPISSTFNFLKSLKDKVDD